MKLVEVKANMGRTVYYSFDCKVYECILSACIFRIDKSGKPYYQAELSDTKRGHSVMIANLKDVFLHTDLKQN